VGFCCAAKLAEAYVDGMADAEREHKNARARRAREHRTWCDEGRWRISKKGNLWRKTRDGFRATIYAGNGEWHAVVSHPDSDNKGYGGFPTVEAAQLGTWDILCAARDVRAKQVRQ
jgi:hypothetical protein